MTEQITSYSLQVPETGKWEVQLSKGGLIIAGIRKPPNIWFRFWQYIFFGIKWRKND